MEPLKSKNTTITKLAAGHCAKILSLQCEELDTCKSNEPSMKVTKKQAKLLAILAMMVCEPVVQ